MAVCGGCGVARWLSVLGVGWQGGCVCWVWGGKVAVCTQFSSEVSEELRVWAGSDRGVVLELAKQCFLELSSCEEEKGVTRQAVCGSLLGHTAAQMDQCRLEALQHWEQVRGIVVAMAAVRSLQGCPLLMVTRRVSCCGQRWRPSLDLWS